MAETMPYRPEFDAPLGTERPAERLVFVHPKDDGRVFEVSLPQTIGADSPEVGQAVADAYAAAERARVEEAAACQPEQDATPETLAQAISWNGQAVVATRQYAEVNGL